MNPVNPVRTNTHIDNVQSQAQDVDQVGGFSQMLLSEQTQETAPTQSTVSAQRSQAIAHFYEIHQRSQITGVPTSEYNAAVAALGLDATKDAFAAIKLLEEAGYETGAPSLGAILKYGSVPQASGNQSYLAQAAEAKPKITPFVVGNVQASAQGTAAQDTSTQEATTQEATTQETPAAQALLQVQAQLAESAPEVVDQRPDQSAVTQEIQALNQQYGGVLGGSGNYFEAVKHMSKQVDITPYLRMTLDQALPMIAAALEANQLGMTTDRWLQGKG